MKGGHVPSQTTPPDRPLTRQDVMTADDVGHLVGIARTSVYEKARTGEIPCMRSGRIIRFRRWEIEAWIAGNGGR